MKTTLLALFFLFLLHLTSCNKDKANVIDNQWIATSIVLENDVILTPNSNYYLSFESKDQFSLSLDINHCGGEVHFKKNTVEFKSGAYCTEACCDSDFAITLLNQLTQIEQWELIENQLIFSNPRGLKIVFLQKQ